MGNWRGRRHNDFGYRSAHRGITRSRLTGAWDRRRGPRPATIERERWMDALLAYWRALEAITL